MFLFVFVIISSVAISCFIIVLAVIVSPAGNPETTARGAMAQLFALFVLFSVGIIVAVVAVADEFEGT